MENLVHTMKLRYLWIFKYLSAFEPNKHTQDYRSRKPNYEKFLFEIENKKYIYVREKYLVLKQMIQC